MFKRLVVFCSIYKNQYSILCTHNVIGTEFLVDSLDCLISAHTFVLSQTHTQIEHCCWETVIYSLQLNSVRFYMTNIYSQLGSKIVTMFVLTWANLYCRYVRMAKRKLLSSHWHQHLHTFIMKLRIHCAECLTW